jgi:hypothetical protein
MTTQEFDFDPLGDNRPRRLAGNFTTKKYPLKIGTPNPDTNMFIMQKTNQIVITMPTEQVRQILFKKVNEKKDDSSSYINWYGQALLTAMRKSNQFNYWLEHQKAFMHTYINFPFHDETTIYDDYVNLRMDTKQHHIQTMQDIILKEGCLLKTIKVYSRIEQKWLTEIQYYEDRFSDGGLCGYGAIYFKHPYGEITKIINYMS